MIKQHELLQGRKKAGNLNKILSIIIMSVCCSCKVQDISFSQHFTQMAKFQAGKSLHNLGWNWKRRLKAPWFENMRQVKQDQLIVWLPHGFVVICYDIMMFKKRRCFLMDLTAWLEFGTIKKVAECQTERFLLVSGGCLCPFLWHHNVWLVSKNFQNKVLVNEILLDVLNLPSGNLT